MFFDGVILILLSTAVYHTTIILLYYVTNDILIRVHRTVVNSVLILYTRVRTLYEYINHKYHSFTFKIISLVSMRSGMEYFCNIVFSEIR